MNRSDTSLANNTGHFNLLTTADGETLKVSSWAQPDAGTVNCAMQPLLHFGYAVRCAEGL